MNPIELHMVDLSTYIPSKQVYDDIYCDRCKRRIVSGIVIYMHSDASYCSKRCRYKLHGNIS